MRVSSDFFFFQAEDGIRDLVRSRGLGDVYKRQVSGSASNASRQSMNEVPGTGSPPMPTQVVTPMFWSCLLYTSDAADERSSVDLGGRRIIKKKKREDTADTRVIQREIYIDNTIATYITVSVVASV